MDLVCPSTIVVFLFLIMRGAHANSPEHRYNNHVDHGESGGKSYAAVAVGTTEIKEPEYLSQNSESAFFETSENHELAAQYADAFKHFNIQPNSEQAHSHQAVDISETIYRHVPQEIIKHVPVKVPQKIEVPVPHIVEIPVLKPYSVPYEVVNHIPVPVVTTKTIEVERPIAYEVVKHVPVQVEKHVSVPVDRPYEVVKHVEVPIHKAIRIPVHVHKKYPVHIVKHVHHKD